jgi:hypothetical protein
MNHYLIGSWLFLMGCLAFTLDAFIGITSAMSIRSISYLTGTLLFTAGCVHFVVDARKRINRRR